jgi:hypothetical protein
MPKYDKSKQNARENKKYEDDWSQSPSAWGKKQSTDAYRSKTDELEKDWTFVKEEGDNVQSSEVVAQKKMNEDFDLILRATSCGTLQKGWSSITSTEIRKPSEIEQLTTRLAKLEATINKLAKANDVKDGQKELSIAPTRTRSNSDDQMDG